jgi:hypothetical protein
MPLHDEAESGASTGIQFDDDTDAADNGDEEVEDEDEEGNKSDEENDYNSSSSNDEVADGEGEDDQALGFETSAPTSPTMHTRLTNNEVSIANRLRSQQRRQRKGEQAER